MNSVVVFPAPFGPRSATRSPARTVRSTPSTARIRLYCLTSPRARSTSPSSEGMLRVSQSEGCAATGFSGGAPAPDWEVPMGPDLHTAARRLRNVVEPIAAGVYFAPEARDRYRGLGLDFFEGYFCSRGACLGKAPWR